MKIIATLLLIILLNNCFAQEIVNVVLIKGDSITQNPKEADAFVIMKKFESHLQRLDYKKNAPLLKERNFTDSTLSILDGKYCK